MVMQVCAVIIVVVSSGDVSRQRQISCKFIQILFMYFINPFFICAIPCFTLWLFCRYVFMSVTLHVIVYVFTCLLCLYMFVTLYVYYVHEDTNKLQFIRL